MSSPDLGFGVPTVQFGLTDTATTLPSLQTSVITAAETAWTRRRKNTSFKNLSGDYKVGVALMGYDDENGGYAIAEMSDLSSTITVAAGEGILIELATLPAGMVSAVAASIWLQKGTALPQLAGYAYVDDTGNPFSYMLRKEPSLAAPRVAEATLISAAATTDLLKYRTPKGSAWTSKVETTGGIQFPRSKQTAEYQPDSTLDTRIPLGSNTSLRFSIYSTGLDDLADNVGGDFVEYTATGGDTVQLLDSDPHIIASTLDGNRAIKCLMPADNNGKAITRLFIGNTIINVSDSNEEWVKDRIYRLDVECAPLAFDDLLKTCDTGIYYVRYE
jgi:hypothetical protein